MLVPVEAAAVNNHSTDCSTMSANPLGRRMDNDVGAMLNRTDIIATCTKSVVDLSPVSSNQRDRNDQLTTRGMPCS